MAENEWVTGVMTSINGAICFPWPCTTYQEVVSESTVLAALEDEGAEGSEAEAYTPEDEAGETWEPLWFWRSFLKSILWNWTEEFRNAGIL